MSTTIYAFLSDEAFADVGIGSVIKYSAVNKSEMGMLDDNLLNYFIEHSIILDPVGNTSYQTNRQFRVLADQFENVRPQGRMLLHFDYSKLSEVDVAVINSFNITDTDVVDQIKKDKSAKRAALFNIVETIFMAHNTSNNPVSLDELERMLTSVNQNASTYFGYVAASLRLSSTSSKAAYRTMRDETTNEKFFYDSCSFDFEYESNKRCTFVIWLSSAEFKKNYPYSTIIDCIYPCSPKWILNPESYSSQVKAVIEAANYKDSKLDTAVTEHDHSGLSVYTSKYVFPGIENAKMGFVLMYKGATPDSKAMRNYLRDKLLAETDENGNPLGTIENWKSRLPDLFIDGEFYLIPMYMQRVQYPSNIQIERTVLNYREIYDKTVQILSNLSPDQIFENMEIVQAPGHDLFIAAVPSDMNSEHLSIEKLHPTYQAIDAVDDINSHWNTMTIITKEFAEMMAKCLAVCLDENTAVKSEFTADAIGTREAFSFVNNYINFVMLSAKGGSDILAI